MAYPFGHTVPECFTDASRGLDHRALIAAVGLRDDRRAFGSSPRACLTVRGDGQRPPLPPRNCIAPLPLLPLLRFEHAGYPPADPELCAEAPARSPARANRRAWGRAQWSPPPATTVPQIQVCPRRKSPPAGRGHSCPYDGQGTVSREWQARDHNGAAPFLV